MTVLGNRNKILTCGNHVDVNLLTLKIHGTHGGDGDVVGRPRNKGVKRVVVVGGLGGFVSSYLRWSLSQVVEER